MMAKALAHHPQRDSNATLALVEIIPTTVTQGGMVVYRILDSLRKLLLEGLRPPSDTNLAPCIRALDIIIEGQGTDTPIVARQVKKLLLTP